MNKIYDSLTKEQRKIYNHCRHSALKYFNVQKGYVLHHKDDTLMLTDVNRYIEWRPEDLVVMTLSEHSKLHNTGLVRSEETREKMSKANKGRQPWLGKHHSEETKKKISKANKGKHLTEEQKKAISMARKGKPTFTGKHHSEETKQKMREAWDIRRARRNNKCT